MQSTKTPLQEFVEKLWDGDVSYDEFLQLSGLAEDQAKLDEINITLAANKEFFSDGNLPFPGDDKTYDDLLATEQGAMFLQAAVSRVD